MVELTKYSLRLAILHWIFHETCLVSSQSEFNGSNPFKFSPLTPTNSDQGGLLWEDLGCVTQNGDTILHPSTGFVANGHVCGILGPSGSGKSTLMSIIAGRPEASLTVRGQVLHYYSYSKPNKNGDDLHSLHYARVLPDSVAWLQQQDAFFEHLTVQETLDLAVFLEWPHVARAERNKIASNCLETLGLAKVKSRRVGNPSQSHGASLSGGELRRLSVALELVTNPHLFIADEPSNGIDAKMAENVMAGIVSLAKKRQIPCFCTLHQPRSSIWHMLDSLILMAPGGRICYIGSLEDSITYFEALGFTCPDETNPAEYFVDLVSVDSENPVQAKKDRERIHQLATAFEKHNRGVHSQGHQATTQMKSRHELPRSNPLRIVRRLGALFRRSWRQSIRSYGLNAFRMLMSAGTAVLLSQIFPSVVIKGTPNSKSVSDRICVLSFGAINMFLIAVVKSIGIFTIEKPVVQREKCREDYTSLEYIVSKALAEIPTDATFALVFATTLKLVTGLAIGWKEISGIFALMTVAGASLGFSLGSVAKSQEAASATAMPVVILLMVVGVINPSGVDPTAATPLVVHWVKLFSPIASAIEGLVVAEFSGIKFANPSVFDMQRYRDLPRMGGLALVRSGDETIEALGLQGIQLDAVLVHMVGLSLVNFGLCWIGLTLSNSGWIDKIWASFKRQKRRFMNGRRMEVRSKKVRHMPSYLPRLRYNSSAP